MRSLSTKLTLAFLLVGLTGAILVAIIIRQQTRNAFDRFILNQDQQALAANLIVYYQERGNWQGMGEILQSFQQAQSGNTIDGPGPRRDFMRFVLVGADKTVVFSPLPDQVGKQVSNRELNRGVTLQVNGETAGWLLPPPVPRQWLANSPEGAFLMNVNRATLASALVAALMALVLGGVLAFTMTRSLRELTEATVEIARGKLGMQVKVRSKDELGELATSFNKMSLDLEQATRARRQMTADIAHDLRSPLSVISGYAEALSDGKLPGTPEVYNILHQETRQLSRLVEDLRLISLADAGELQLILQPCDPQALLERVSARHAVTAQQHGVALRVAADPGLPMLSLDSERMAQVLDNLVLNAFRYTPPSGEILLSARQQEQGFEIQVKDNGSGIPPEELPHIFDRFYRGDKARQQNGESGLGLAIAKSIVEAHGGTIRAESTPGEGSTFTISLQPA
jgi:two-component system, OmpR family, sensor histidine kinase BaeS